MAKRNRKSKSNSKNIINNYLPEDVLRQIFSHLHRFDILKSTSLVCKLFCSLSSPLVHELTVKDSSLTCSDLQRLFKRFTLVKKIRIKIPKLDNALLAICNFDLINLEKLEFSQPQYMNVQYPEPQTLEIMSTSRVIKGIKSLKLSWCGRQTIWMVIEFINMFPSLTELNISYGLSKDILIEKVTSNLPNLRKISLSHYNLLSDKTLDILSSNCPKLESINFPSCQRFTPEALYKFFCNNPQLSSVRMRNLPSVSKLVKCMQVLQNINHLSLKTDVVRDALLIALADSRHPLKSLSLVIYRASSSRKYTMSGLSRLLSKCPDLISLKVQLPYVENSNTQDAEMSIVVKRLPNLKHISIWSRVVCQATLFSLVQNCPLLETIRLLSCRKCSRSKQVCDQEGIPRPTKKNNSIKFISVNPESNTWLLSTVEPYCPNLRKSKRFMD